MKTLFLTAGVAVGLLGIPPLILEVVLLLKAIGY